MSLTAAYTVLLDRILAGEGIQPRFACSIVQTRIVRIWAGIYLSVFKIQLFLTRDDATESQHKLSLLTALIWHATVRVGGQVAL